MYSHYQWCMDNSVIISITMALYTRGLLHASVPVIYTYQTIHYASTHTDSVYIYSWCTTSV